MTCTVQLNLVAPTTTKSVDMVKLVIFDYMSPHCDLELEDSKPIFSRETLAYDEAS